MDNCHSPGLNLVYCSIGSEHHPNSMLLAVEPFQHSDPTGACMFHSIFHIWPCLACSQRFSNVIAVAVTQHPAKPCPSHKIDPAYSCTHTSTHAHTHIRTHTHPHICATPRRPSPAPVQAVPERRAPNPPPHVFRLFATRRSIMRGFIRQECCSLLWPMRSGTAAYTFLQSQMRESAARGVSM